MKYTFVFSLVMAFLVGCGGNQEGKSTEQSTWLLSASWGESRDTVLAKFAAEGLQLVQDSVNLVFAGGTYEGYAVDQWDLTFNSEGQLRSGMITFTPDTAGTTVFADVLTGRLTEKYGTPAEPMVWIISGTTSGTSASLRLHAIEGSPVVLMIEGPTAASVTGNPDTETAKTE